MKFIYWACHTFSTIVARAFYDFRVIHPERLVEHGPALIASNHVSFFDPPLVAISMKTPIHFLARKTLFRNKYFGGLIRKLNSIPVDQDRPDFTSLKKIIQLLKAGERVLIFPEGSRTLDGSLGEAQPGVGLIVTKSKSPVVPMRIFGAENALPRGSKWPRLCRITLVVGEPLDFTQDIEEAAGSKEVYGKISLKIMEAVAALKLPDSD